MAKYYLFCEKHDRASDYFSDPNKASKARRKHRERVDGPHGKISVIEENIINKYGQEVIHLRQYKKP